MKCEIKDCKYHQYSSVFYVKSYDYPDILSWPEVEALIKKGVRREIFQAVPSDLHFHDMTKYELILAYAKRRVNRIAHSGKIVKR